LFNVKRKKNVFLPEFSHIPYTILYECYLSFLQIHIATYVG